MVALANARQLCTNLGADAVRLAAVVLPAAARLDVFSRLQRCHRAAAVGVVRLDRDRAAVSGGAPNRWRMGGCVGGITVRGAALHGVPDSGSARLCAVASTRTFAGMAALALARSSYGMAARAPVCDRARFVPVHELYRRAVDRADAAAWRAVRDHLPTRTAACDHFALDRGDCPFRDLVDPTRFTLDRHRTGAPKEYQRTSCASGSRQRAQQLLRLASG